MLQIAQNGTGGRGTAPNSGDMTQFWVGMLIAAHPGGQVLLFLPTVCKQQQGNMIKICLQWAQRVAGISRALSTEPDLLLPQLQEELWLATLRAFLSALELGMWMQGTEVPQPLWDNDSVLMDWVHEQGSKVFSAGDIAKINQCCLHLQVECLSKLCDESGRALWQDAWEGQ